jgi:murein DD-endopeptidase MepM/ murein hydrolase activator NlpD
LSSGSTETIKRVQEVLVKKTKVRKEIFQNQTILQNRRSENERRRNAEDQLEASNLVIKPGGAAQLIQSSTKGFLERILGFLGYLTAGWLMNNLPTWIAMGKEFIARAQRMGQLISGFVGNITNIFLGFGSLLSATYQNLIQFDLFDSSNRVKDAFGQLTGSADEMRRELEESIRLLTTPLSEGIMTGEDAPGTGQNRTSEGAYEPGAPYTGIEGPETSGGRVSPQAVYAYLRSKGIGHIHAMGILANIEGESGFQIGAQEKGGSKQGVGLFQYTFPSRKQAFLQAVPDYKTNWKGQIDFAMGKDPNTPLYLRRQFSSPEEAADNFMIQWENPDPAVYSGRRRKHNQFIKSFKPGIPSQQITSQQIQSLPGRQVTTTVRDEINVAGRSGGTSTVGLTPGQGFGAPRRGRRHAGVDIGTSGQRGYYVSFRQSGTVTYARNNGRGYGNLVIIKSGNIEFYFAHLASIFVKEGRQYNGETIGEIGGTGGNYAIHLHFEARPGGNPVDPKPYLGLLSIGKQLTGVSGQSIGSISTSEIPATQSQIASIQRQQTQQSTQQITRQRTGPTIIISETPASEPQVIQSSPGSSNAPSLEIDEFTLLNNFMKNKLLLDLAYL